MTEKETLRGTHKLIDQRFEKLDELKKKGVNPYPRRWNSSHTPGELHEEYKSLSDDTWTGDIVTISGRIKLTRRMGKIAFFDIENEDETVQLYFREEDTHDYDTISLYELGDILGVKGEVMTSRSGELTVQVHEHTLLTKAVRPLPDKFHGVQDTEIKYRKRYLDTLMNKESRQVFKQRDVIMHSVRSTLRQKEFMEVETPVLHPLYGGANAKPFTTFHNDLGEELYLRISPELYLKRLLVGGFNKVFDLNRNFRNESIDTTHNPEYTMLEVYEAYSDYEQMMELTEEIFKNACIAVHGEPTCEYEDTTLDFSGSWERKTMAEAVEEELDINVLEETEERLRTICDEKNIEYDGESWGYYVQGLFEELCEENIIQPTFIIDHPIETTPLCKPTGYDERLVERFEPFCMGMEIANAYTELNDPELQRELLVEQARRKEAGDEEANPLDEDFLEAIEHGMPPAGGLGIGIDRMVMLLLDKQSIKDVILFPAMKNKDE